MPKYFFSLQQIVGDTIAVEGTIAHHVLHVLRMAAGDSVVFCDGAETDYTATIKSSNPKKTQVIFKLTNPQKCLTELPRRIVLHQALTKGDKMELIMQKCVELGVHEIVPVMTSHCVVRIKDAAKKAVRYQQIVESAAGQSMRGIVPRVSPAITFENALNQVDSNGQTLVAHEREQELSLVSALTTANAIDIWVGPEGGFTDQEIVALKNRGAVTVSLGPRILRAETAAIAAVATVALNLGVVANDNLLR